MIALTLEERAARDRLAELARDQQCSLKSLSEMIGRNPAYLQQYVMRKSPRRLEEGDPNGPRVDIVVPAEPIDAVPAALGDLDLALSDDRTQLVYSYDTRGEGGTGITTLLTRLRDEGVRMTDISTHQSSLEEIFVDLVEHNQKEAAE